MEILDLRKRKGDWKKKGTMEEYTMKIGEILQRERDEQKKNAEIDKIFKEEVSCGSCSGRFILKDSYTPTEDENTLVKFKCPYCGRDSAIRMSSE